MPFNLNAIHGDEVLKIFSSAQLVQLMQKRPKVTSRRGVKWHASNTKKWQTCSQSMHNHNIRSLFYNGTDGKWNEDLMWNQHRTYSMQVLCVCVFARARVHARMRGWARAGVVRVHGVCVCACVRACARSVQVRVCVILRQNVMLPDDIPTYYSKRKSCGLQNFSRSGLQHHEYVRVRNNSDCYFYIKVLKHWKDATWQKMAVKLRNSLSCTMTMYLDTPPSQCSSFWWRTKFQPSPSHYTLQISFCATSNCFPESLSCVYRRRWMECYSTAQSHTTRGASRTSRFNGENVCLPNGHHFQGDQIRFYSPSCGNILILHVVYLWNVPSIC
jgi:hypothetical protein